MINLNYCIIFICEESNTLYINITGNVIHIKTCFLYNILQVVYINLLPIINMNYIFTKSNVDIILIERILVILITQRFVSKINISNLLSKKKYK